MDHDDMNVYLGGVPRDLDVHKLTLDLEAKNCKIVTISRVGELVIDDFTHGPDYEYRREVWQMREPGEGVNNETWGGHEWEFCRSVKLTAEGT